MQLSLNDSIVSKTLFNNLTQYIFDPLYSIVTHLVKQDFIGAPTESALQVVSKKMPDN